MMRKNREHRQAWEHRALRAEQIATEAVAQVTEVKRVLSRWSQFDTSQPPQDTYGSLVGQMTAALELRGKHDDVLRHD